MFLQNSAVNPIKAYSRKYGHQKEYESPVRGHNCGFLPLIFLN